VPCACIGSVMEEAVLEIDGASGPLVAAELATLKAAWQAPLDWS
jgi:hypothetical protein